MNKKNNRKGFTTVELVIVIAVIAILATVLIPTFSNLIEKANESAALQEASSTFKSYTIENATSFSDETIYVVADGYVFKVEGGQLKNKPETANTDATPEIPCSAVVITTATSDEGFTTTVTLPTGFEQAAHKDEVPAGSVDNKCDVCGAKMN